jgi:two-component system response regulator FixJ
MTSTVFLVDDDHAVRDALTQLLAGSGLRVQAYGSAEEFLAAYNSNRAGCLLLDMRLPGASGAALQAGLKARGSVLPIIFLTAHGSVADSVQALKAGAFDFLEKPPEPAQLVERVRSALRLDSQQRRERAASQDAMAKITPREREIMPLVAAGCSCKEIGKRLGISHRTVELHRMRVMRKMGAQTVVGLASLVKACESESAAHGASAASNSPR